MGYAIPAALGAKVADPGRQVVAVCGDGSFQMSMMELGTMTQHDIHIKIVVIRNNYLGMVREYQHYTYQDHYTVVDIAGKPDLDKIAQAYGLPYLRVDGKSNVESTINEFLQNDESMLMEVLVDPSDLVRV